jgi:hypothetical protein
METKNFLVQFEIDGQEFETDFFISIIGPMAITNEIKNIYAWKQIKKSYPDVKREEVSNIRITDLPD